MEKALDILSPIASASVLILAIASDDGFGYTPSIIVSAALMVNALALFLAKRRLR